MKSVTSKRRFFTKKSFAWLTALLLVVGAGSFGFYRHSLPVGSPSVQYVLQTQQEESAPNIPWPAAQASIGTTERGVLASKPGQTPRPTASTAKLITVLTVLKEKPLAPGEQGPTLTIEQSDIDLYNSYYAAGGSLVEVSLGEQMTQYQMLQAILIRSSNSLADSLALWAFGSMSEYQKAAQEYVDELGMTNTTVGTDASGLSPTTTSTAEDLVRLGVAAMNNDVVREIVRQPTSNFPTDGTKPNTNWMLGQNGVVGIKTGNIPEVGGVFVIASEYEPERKEPITIVGAVQGEATTYAAIAESGRLAEAAKALFVEKTVIKKGTVVVTIATPWGESSEVVAEEDVKVFGWKYDKLEPKVELQAQAPFQKGDVLGKVSVGDQSSNLVAASEVNQPSWQWRLTTKR